MINPKSRDPKEYFVILKLSEQQFGFESYPKDYSVACKIPASPEKSTKHDLLVEAIKQLRHNYRLTPGVKLVIEHFEVSNNQLD